MNDKGGFDFDDDERPLSPEERHQLRAMLESERRMRWFYSSIRIWASWAVGVSAAVYGVYKAVGDLGFFRKF